MLQKLKRFVPLQSQNKGRWKAKEKEATSGSLNVEKLSSSKGISYNLNRDGEEQSSFKK